MTRKRRWLLAVMTGILALAMALEAAVGAAPPPASPPAERQGDVYTYTCPVDKKQFTHRVVTGPAEPSRNSDLEGPSTPYAAYVAGCPGCGYAMWIDRFENPVSDGVKGLVLRLLREHRYQANQDPRVAYEHLQRILAYSNAPLRDQLTAALFHSYIIKRKRPQGSADVRIELALKAARVQARTLLQRAKAADPPRDTRGMWEWTYLDGELARLSGQPEVGLNDLAAVCKYREEAGNAVGKLACAQADKARKGDSVETYRGEMYDIKQIDAQAPPPPSPSDGQPSPGSPPPPPPPPHSAP